MRWRTGEHNRQVQQKLDDFEYGMPLKIGQKETPWSTVTPFKNFQPRLLVHSPTVAPFLPSLIYEMWKQKHKSVYETCDKIF